MTNAISQTTSPFLKTIINTNPLTASQTPIQTQTLTPKEEFDRDVFLKEYIKEKEKEGVNVHLYRIFAFATQPVYQEGKNFSYLVCRLYRNYRNRAYFVAVRGL